MIMVLSKRILMILPFQLLMVLSCANNATAATTDDDALTQNNNKQPMLVLGAGLGRTGTNSLQVALDRLGFKTYHMMEAFRTPHHLAVWANASHDFTSVVNLLATKGYNATVDYPAADYLPELLRHYPTAKVILSVRDTPAQWAKSWRVLTDIAQLTEEPFRWTYPTFLPWLPLFADIHNVRCAMGTRLMGVEPCALVLERTKTDDDEWLQTQYNKHNARVQEIMAHHRTSTNDAPAAAAAAVDQKPQLLVFNVKQGWAPLCQFLELSPQDCPPGGNQDEPFPWVNDTTTMKRLGIVVRVAVYSWIPLSVLLFYGLYSFVGKRLAAGVSWKQKKKKE